MLQCRIAAAAADPQDTVDNIMNRLQELSRRLLDEKKPSRMTRQNTDETVRAGRPTPDTVSNGEKAPKALR